MSEIDLFSASLGNRARSGHLRSRFRPRIAGKPGAHATQFCHSDVFTTHRV